MKFLLLILLFLSLLTHAQKSRKTAEVTPWEVGLSAGASWFVTSVNPEAPPNRINYWNPNMNPGFGLSVTHNFSPALGMEAGWLNTRLTGEWDSQYPLPTIAAGRESPLTFDSRLNQFDLLMTFNMNQLFLPGDLEDPWHIFTKAGFGMTMISDQMKFYPDGSQYLKFGPTLDVGFSYSLNEKLKLQVGSAWRFVDTDNLDGVHVTSPTGAAYFKVYEVYNFNYLRLTCRLKAKDKSRSHNMRR